MNFILREIAKSKLKEIQKEEVIATPFVFQRPSRQAYGLTDDTEEILRKADEEYIKNEKTTATVYSLIVIVLGFALGIAATYNIAIAIKYSMISILPSILVYLYYTNGKPPQTKLHRDFARYMNDIKNYKYWQRMKDYNFWTRLTGTAFEYYLAEVFNANGYKSTLTKTTGDKGVDIILEKNSDIIIVQCKAHQAKIGPNVAIKLTKSMNYFGVTKGILASVSGFTPGVYEYVSDKNIELMDTNDILKLIK